LIMDMTTSVRNVGDVTVVDISGRIVLGDESAALRDLIAELLSKGDRKIVLDLAAVNYIDSSGLGALVSSFDKVGDHAVLPQDGMLVEVAWKVCSASHPAYVVGTVR
jgi:anti-anti-sigma factor